MDDWRPGRGTKAPHCYKIDPAKLSPEIKALHVEFQAVMDKLTAEGVRLADEAGLTDPVDRMDLIGAVFRQALDQLREQTPGNWRRFEPTDD